MEAHYLGLHDFDEPRLLRRRHLLRRTLPRQGSRGLPSVAWAPAPRYCYDATATATADENAANDTATARVNVEPVADMTVTAPGGTVLMDRRVTIVPTVINAGAQSASQVAVTITPGAGLRVEDMRWAQGLCSTVENVVTCEAGSLSVSSSDISVDVTGVSVGDRSYAVEVASVTADAHARRLET